jgi:hypothetical protein
MELEPEREAEPEGSQSPRLWRILWPLGLAVVVFLITGIPYAIAYFRPPPGMVFGGFLGYPEDVGMYFSFIRQAADGHVLFINRLTYLPHDPIFLNPQWLLVGWVMAWLGDSGELTFQVWRAAGALALMFGFADLAGLVLRDRLQRAVAMLMFAFGGGFRWLWKLLDTLAPNLPILDDPSFGWQLDLVSGTHPFHQILMNPHFSLPLGMFLFFFAWYIRGELTGRARCYGIAAALAAVEGMMRPYDLIVLYTALPLYIAMEMALSREIDPRKLALRTLPLVAAAPPFLYSIYIFRFHSVFKYWSSQGFAYVLPLSAHLLVLGLAGWMLAARVILVKWFPLRTSAERLMLVWFGTVLFFAHAYKLPMFHFMPYAFQLATTIMPPVILLGVAIIGPASGNRWDRRPLFQTVFLTGLLLVNSLSGAHLVTNLSRALLLEKGDGPFIYKTEIEGFKRLQSHATERDIVLSTRDTGNKLTRYASVRVVAGHWTLTPHIAKLDPRVQRFFRGDMSQKESREFLEEAGATWIYWGCNESELRDPDPVVIPGFRKLVVNKDVVLYSLEGDGAEKSLR